MSAALAIIALLPLRIDSFQPDESGLNKEAITSFGYGYLIRILTAVDILVGSVILLLLSKKQNNQQ